LEEKKYAAYVAVEAATYSIDKPYEYLIPEAMLKKIAPGVRVRVSFGNGSRRTEGIVLNVHELTSKTGLRLKTILDIIDETPVFSDKLIKLGLWLREQCFCTFFDIAHSMLPSGVWRKYETAYFYSGKIEYEDAESQVSGIEQGTDILKCIYSSVRPYKSKDLITLFGRDSVEKTIRILLKNEVISVTEYSAQKVSDKTERTVSLAISEEETKDYIARKKCKLAVIDALSFLEKVESVSSRELSYFTGISASQLNTLKKNGVIAFGNEEVYRRPKPSAFSKKQEITLNASQEQVFQQICSDMRNGATCALLHGVTGSGKTLIYFKLIEKVIADKKTAILLVPEISLTPQLLEKVYSYFGERTAVMHSALSVGERYDEWKRIRNGEVDVVVGTRSAIFSPLDNIGIIILDEEQEDTYKSSSTPRYHAVQVAKFRCVNENAMLLLGSATPSVESMYYAKTGKYKLYTLPERYNKKPLPKVIISDLRKSLTSGSGQVIGKELYEELSKNISNNEQSILFLNRRGSSKFLVCDECGESPGCPNCSVPLVYHSKNNRLMCHHCGYSEKKSDECVSCGHKLKPVGFGTQKVEQELKELFPEIEIIRMDTDTTAQKTAHEKLLGEFKDNNVPVLLGTQMITKGLDFENVTLVGVLLADQGLSNENYKAAENSFSLMTQVVGRAGRGGKEGRAVIQTFSPDNVIIRAAAEQVYDAFFDNEIKIRRSRKLPPFGDVFTLTVLADKEYDSFCACDLLCKKAKYVIDTEYSDLAVRILGPTPLSVLKVNNRYRYKMMLCADNNRRTRDLISRLIRDFAKDSKNKGMSIIPDINSIDF